VSAEHQGNFPSDDDLSERIAETLKLPALDYSLNEERDESKKSKGPLSDLENNGADSGDGLQQTVFSFAEDVAHQRETTASIPEDLALLHERLDDRNDRLYKELEEEKEAVGGIEMNPRQEIENERFILAGYARKCLSGLDRRSLQKAGE
jgi:hypothetical protein